MINKLNMSGVFQKSFNISEAAVNTGKPSWIIKNSINSRLFRIMHFQNIILGKTYYYNQTDGTTNHP